MDRTVGKSFSKGKCQLLSSVLQISVLDQGLGCDVSCWVVLHQVWIERRKAPWWWWLWRRCWDGGPPGDVDCDDTEHAEHTSLATWGFYRSRLSHSVSHSVSLNKITIIVLLHSELIQLIYEPNVKSCVNTQNIMNDFKETTRRLSGAGQWRTLFSGNSNWQLSARIDNKWTNAISAQQEVSASMNWVVVNEVYSETRADNEDLIGEEKEDLVIGGTGDGVTWHSLVLQLELTMNSDS